MNDKELVKHQASCLIPISEPKDLLKARPIASQLREVGTEVVHQLVMIAVEKCAIGLDIKMSELHRQILVEDLIETYKFDSIEDLYECLKNGRRGNYGFGHNQRGKLTMLVIKEWMKEHLEKKAKIREQASRSANPLDDTKLEHVDYEAYKKKSLKAKEKAKTEQKRVLPKVVHTNDFSTTWKNIHSKVASGLALNDEEQQWCKENHVEVIPNLGIRSTQI